MDSPRKRHIDARFVSWQPHEIRYVVDTIYGMRRGHTKAAIQKAVEACKRKIQPSEGRSKLMGCVLSRLS